MCGSHTSLFHDAFFEKSKSFQCPKRKHEVQKRKRDSGNVDAHVPFCERAPHKTQIIKQEMSCMTFTANSEMPKSNVGCERSSLDRKTSFLLSETVRDNLSPKTLKLLGDKTLMPRAARKRLGSSLSGDQLHDYIEAMKKEQQ